MSLFNKLYVFFLRKFRVYSKKHIVQRDSEILKDKDFVIIADNCWGGAVYQWYNRPYNSPFAGMRIHGECYLKLLSNFDFYMNKSLVFIEESKYKDRKITYPLALLSDVEIHFTHYKTMEEAKTKWERRTERMLQVTNKDHYFIKICDACKADEEHFKKFHELPFKNKISFAQKDKKIVDSEFHININQRHKDDRTTVPNGIKLFKITFLYFDLTQWLSTSIVKRTTYKS